MEPPATDTYATSSDGMALDYPPDGGDEFANAVIGNEIFYFFGNKVMEHATSTGALRALKVRPPKFLSKSEGDTMNYAASHGILAPRVYGTYAVKTTHTVAMVLSSDRIPGKPLVDVWSTYTDAEKESVKSQLRTQLELMRTCTQPFIGCPGHQSAHNVYDRIITTRFGPFETEEAFDDWCLARINSLPPSRWMWKRWLNKMRKQSPSKFVLTHGDLTPRNIMVQGSTITGIIDWERGGFFPEYCEYAWAKQLCHSHEKWWLPVLSEVMQPCSKERLKFTEMVEQDGF
jgi:aminoglycoside phosphotransferase